MKKILSFIAALFLLVQTSGVFAFDYSDIDAYPTGSATRVLNFGGFLTVYFNTIAQYEGIPDSYKYIQLNFTNVTPGTELYSALQKGVYMNFMKNAPIDLNLTKIFTEEDFSKITASNLKQELNTTKGKALTLETLLATLDAIYNKPNATEDATTDTTQASGITAVSNFPVLNDVFTKLKYAHYNSSKFRDEELVQGAIKGLAEASGDKYTVYFPPVESKNFQDELGGQFDGIGAYVDLLKPGELRIVSPIAGTPAEKAGLKGGDMILKIDDYVIDANTTLQDAVNKIKGPAGTSVKLHIKRGTDELDFSVTRAKISISYVEYKKLENGDHYVKITTFGTGAADAFNQTLAAIAKDGGSNKVIIDLRNDPGGSLDEVSKMLSNFVPEGQSVVHIKYKNQTEEILSTGNPLLDFSKYNVAILINEGSASASEIMAGTIKDYLPNTKLVGVKSYGKGSVQSLDGYPDGSSFKYTIAKWFTGKTQTGIDGTGIKPDTEIKLDEEKMKNGTDNQLEYVKSMGF